MAPQFLSPVGGVCDTRDCLNPGSPFVRAAAGPCSQRSPIPGVQGTAARGRREVFLHPSSIPGALLTAAAVAVGAQLGARFWPGFGAAEPRVPPGTPHRLPGYLFPDHQREVPRGGRGWKSIPELISAIDDALRRWWPPLPVPSTAQALTAARNRRFVIIQQGNNGLAGCIHHHSGPRGWGRVDVADYLFIYTGNMGDAAGTGEGVSSSVLHPKVQGMP